MTTDFGVAIGVITNSNMVVVKLGTIYGWTSIVITYYLLEYVLAKIGQFVHEMAKVFSFCIQLSELNSLYEEVWNLILLEIGIFR